MESAAPKISVIIPIYNTQQYLSLCIESLMKQTLKKEIEFIFINDCSTDNSLETLYHIIAKYPERINQTTIINHKENKGIAYSREEGIKNAKGIYIGWCDSDDWAEPQLYEQLLKAAETNNTDIAVCNFYIHNFNGIQQTSINGYKSTIEFLSGLYKRNNYFTFSVLWNKIVKREIYLKNCIYPYPGINRSEDLALMVRLCSLSNTIVFINDILYHYNRLNNNSYTHKRQDLSKDWKYQTYNIELLTQFLRENKIRNWQPISAQLQFSIKSEFKEMFKAKEKEYFLTFRDCHNQIMRFSYIPFFNRLNLFLVHSNFFLYSIYSKLKNHV